MADKIDIDITSGNSVFGALKDGDQMDVLVEIDEATGEMTLSRDHEIAVSILEAVGSPDLAEFKAFFEQKSIDPNTKRKNYRTFCG